MQGALLWVSTASRVAINETEIMVQEGSCLAIWLEGYL